MEEITIFSSDNFEEPLKEINYERTAQYYETDQMGIVNHSNYIRWFEEARCHFLSEIGLAYKAIEEMGILIPVLGVSCEYKYSVAYDETVIITPKIVQFNGIKMTIDYTITGKESSEVKSLGQTKHCFVNKDFKPISLKRSFTDVYDLMNRYVVSQE